MKKKKIILCFHQNFQNQSIYYLKIINNIFSLSSFNKSHSHEEFGSFVGSFHESILRGFYI